MIEYSKLKYCFRALAPHFLEEMRKVHRGTDCGSISFGADIYQETSGDNVIVHFSIKDSTSLNDIAFIEFKVMPSNNRRSWTCKLVIDDDNDMKVKFLTTKRISYEQFKDINELVNRVESVRIELYMFLHEIHEYDMDECLDRWSSSLVKWC